MPNIKSIIRRLFDRYKLIGYKNVHKTCHLGRGVKVLSKDNLIMGEQSNINAGAYIMNTRAKVYWGKYSGAAINLVVITGNHMSVPGMNKREVTDAVKDQLDKNHEYDQDVIVEEDVWIGANVILLAGSHIGRGAIVGAGSVVRGKVPPYSVVSGNPAQVVTYRFTYDDIIYHEQKLYTEEERLPEDIIKKEYESFYGVRVNRNTQKTEDVYQLDSYREVYKRVFNVPIEKTDSLAAYQFEGWDSISHLRLIMELENTFGVRVSSDDSRTLKSFDEGLQILEKLGIRFQETVSAAYLFPGQGAQYIGMGKNLYDSSKTAHDYFEKANDILGFRITDKMFEGTEEELRRTEITQPAIFLCSVIPALINKVKPKMVAGHSLGEFSALVLCGALSFEDALKLVSIRAKAMQKACDKDPGKMAAIIQKDISVSNEKIAELCSSVDGIVIPANYNCPGQLIISGENRAVDAVCQKMSEYEHVKTVFLKVGGAFHSPLMKSAQDELEKAIRGVNFNKPLCPIYQNVDASPHSDEEEIKTNLITQLSNPVMWSQTIDNMIKDGATCFKTVGPGDVLVGMLHKINKNIHIEPLAF